MTTTYVDVRAQSTRSLNAHSNGPPLNNPSASKAQLYGGRGRPTQYPHIKDLQRKAQLVTLDYGPYFPVSLQRSNLGPHEYTLTAAKVRRLLDLADDAAKRVTTDVNFKRLDRAYVEYLVCSEILINIVPKNKDYVAISSDRGDWQRRYLALRNQNNSWSAMMKEIYDMITEDNVRNGVSPQSGLESISRSPKETESSHRSPRPLSVPGTPMTSSGGRDELFLQGADTIRSPVIVAEGHAASAAREPSPLRRERPTVLPKPANLRLRPIHPSNTSRQILPNEDHIAERFSRLRVQPQRDAVNGTHVDRQSLSDASFSDESNVPSPAPDSTEHSSQQDSGAKLYSQKPAGPRSMPQSHATPLVPPKLPLSPYHTAEHQVLADHFGGSNTPSKIAADVPNDRHPTLHRKPSIIGTDDRRTRSPKRFSAPQALSNGVTPPSRSSSMQPPRTTIKAAELYDLFQKADVLLIDVRSREEYDLGHILSKSIICIEPVGIEPGMSSEELEDRLINSPGSEMALFERVNKFDYVIYYDSSTHSDRFLQGPPNRTEANHLRAVHDTLYEFNDYKPLRRRPLVLLGGLEAWIDLVGPQALAISTTTAFTGPPNVRRAPAGLRKPLGRLPSASANSSLEVRKRRLREQKHLNADEERSWLEKAHKEEVNPPNLPIDHSDSEAELDGYSGETSPRFAHTYEDFLRRFPEPVAVSFPRSAAPTTRKDPPSAPPPPPPVETIPSVPAMPPPTVPRPSYGGVSDQRSSQYTPISRQNSAAQQPLYTSRTVSRYRKLPRTGLVNFGVTCYMNATLQCLLATIPLSQFFLGDQWRNYTQKNWKGSNGILPEYFANLIRSLWNDDSRPVRPSSLRSFCARLKDEWGVDRQQDAKEFFDFIVDCLHEDLNTNYNRNPLRPLTDQDERIRESWPIQKAAKTEWSRYSHRESSYISELFAGQHASKLKCTTCNSTSTTYEPFYSISVEIPRQEPRRGMWDLHNCLRSYCHEEKLSGDEVWKCPHCKREREATKQITVTRAPQFLVIHFKRFEMRKGDAKKVHTLINFPLYGLDIGDYMVRGDASSNMSYEEDHDPATTAPFVYDCYAVMRHIGNSGNGGHYISLVRDAVRGCWRKFDDDRVSDFDPAKLKGDKSLQNEQAYLLFYGRAAPR